MSGLIDLSGQWVGYGDGDPSGRILLDLDVIGDFVEGWGYLFPDKNLKNIPSTAIPIKIRNFTSRGEISAQPLQINASIGYVFSHDKISQFFPNLLIPNTAKVIYNSISKNKLNLRWETDIGTHGNATLTRGTTSPVIGPHYNNDIKTWSDFKSYVSDLDPKRMVYRGQSEPFPLQTTFHRTKRKDLVRYLREDVPSLHRALSSKTKHLFDLNQPQEMGAFLSLAQHHGFPTPLLDWTYSPYVAAYFAFSKHSDVRNRKPVRLFCLDKVRLQETSPQLQHLTHVFPHLSILEALSIENDRVVPQQGLLTLTNQQNIENYLHYLEKKHGHEILTIMDLPRSESAKAMADLKLMGITRSTLFPGLESICLDTKDRLFS